MEALATTAAESERVTHECRLEHFAEFRFRVANLEMV